MDDKVESVSKKNDSLFLELGYIIQINAPKNSDIHNKIFFISSLYVSLL